MTPSLSRFFRILGRRKAFLLFRADSQELGIPRNMSWILDRKMLYGRKTIDGIRGEISNVMTISALLLVTTLSAFTTATDLQTMVERGWLRKATMMNLQRMCLVSTLLGSISAGVALIGGSCMLFALGSLSFDATRDGASLRAGQLWYNKLKDELKYVQVACLAQFIFTTLNITVFAQRSSAQAGFRVICLLVVAFLGLPIIFIYFPWRIFSEHDKVQKRINQEEINQKLWQQSSGFEAREPNDQQSMGEKTIDHFLGEIDSSFPGLYTKCFTDQKVTSVRILSLLTIQILTSDSFEMPMGDAVRIMAAVRGLRIEGEKPPQNTTATPIEMGDIYAGSRVPSHM